MWTLITIALAALLWLLQFTRDADASQPAWLMRAALGLTVLAGVLVTQRVLSHLMRGAGGRAGARATTDLLRAVMTITLFAVATMLYLRFGMDQDLSGILATSAILTVIIGLALQPTLGQLFAGVSIEIERPLRVGDYIRRDEIEGKVTSLSWRSVYLRTARGSTLVMPNNEVNSRLIEVIAGDQPFRHDVLFNLGTDVAPGKVMRVAMQVLTGDLPGVCATPPPAVVLISNDPATGAMRYAARFYTFEFLTRSVIQSTFLERFWYALSRDGMPHNGWFPRRGRADAAAPVQPERSDADANAAQERAGVALAHDAGEAALAVLGPRLQSMLLARAQTLHYAQFERCDSEAVALVRQGHPMEERPIDAQRAEAAFATLMDELARAPAPAGPRRMSKHAHARMLAEASLALGPLAHALCERIAALTADPHLAYRALAESIPHPILRAQFLANAPLQPSRMLDVGDWLGWAHVLGREATVLPCRASHGCTLLSWSPGVLRALLKEASDEECSALLDLLRHAAPGCADLSAAQLSAWIAHA